ncbi:MAG: TonB-dependent receptor [Alphaproteobacteria bacterium]|nr:MAG: TonB-dependent receptor [alpha proteobacterium MED-G09]|tara:strand:+ start:8191 stop:10557 length:2367 start_codon:yes stop_codon:yes gene_type:complete
MLFKLFKTKLFYFLPLILITQTLIADESVNQSSSAEVNSLTIDEIIVTAEKRTESLQDVSKAVSVFDADELETKNITDFVGLSAIAPGVTVAKNEGYKTIISIRGVGDETNQNAIAAPSVALHMDGIFIASKFSLRTDFIDLERIEVLRGPQGTLFGQNSTGGTVNVINKMPTFDGFYGKADITLGDYGLKKVRGSFNTPISNNISTRNSFVVTDREGFTDNIVNGQDLDDASHISFRSDWLFELGDTSNLRLFYQYFDADNNGAAMKGLDDQTPNPRKLAQDSMSDYQLSSEIFGAIYEVDLGSVSLKILASSQEDDIYVVRDNDRHNFGDIHAEGPLAGLPYIAAEYRPETSLVETKTFEINLISNEPLFGSVDWILGAFYFDHEIENHIYEVKDVNNVKLVDLMDGKFTPYTHDPICSTNPFAGVCFAAFGAELGFVSDAYPTRESQSVYGQATININDSVRVITGFRYTEDTFSSDVTNFFGLNSYLIEDDLEKTTGRIAIEYDLDDDTMTYLSFTKGFKPGGSNLTFGYPVDDEQNFGANPAPQLVFPIFESETIDAYEIGLKTDLLNSRLRANISAFFYKYENLQFQSTDPDIYRGGVANIPESEMSGLEIEFLGIISNEFSFDLRLSFLETEITSEYEALDNIRAELYFFGEEPIRYTLRESIKGNKLAKSPEFNANFGLMYEKVLSSGKLLKATAEVVHRGDFQQRVFNNPFVDAVDEYTIYNLSLSYEISDKIGLDLIALNISDEDGVNSSMTDVFGVAGTGIELIPPRQFMGRLSYNF